MTALFKAVEREFGAVTVDAAIRLTKLRKLKVNRIMRALRDVASIGGGRDGPARWPRSHFASSEPGTASRSSFIFRPSRSLDAGTSNPRARIGAPVQCRMGERVPGRESRSQSTRTRALTGRSQKWHRVTEIRSEAIEG